MDRDFIIGMVLIFLILFGWSYFGPKPPEPEQNPDAQTATDPDAPTPEMVATGDTPLPVVKAAADGTPGAIPVATPADTAATADGSTPAPAVAAVDQTPVLPPVKIGNETVVAEFSNVGGRLTSWRLQKFNDKAGPDGRPLDLVATRDAGRPMLATYWVGSGPTLAEKDTYRIVTPGPDQVVFERDDPAGFRITKTYTPDFDHYSVNLAVKIESTGAASGQGRLSLSMFQENVAQRSSFFHPNLNMKQFAAYVGGSLETKVLEKAPGVQYPGNVLWAGFEDVYFLSAVAPGVSETTQIQVLGPKAQNDPLAAVLTLPESSISPGQAVTFDFASYFGPKSETILAAAGHSFDQALDFGWFTTISKMLVRFLQFLHRTTGNWGVAIIITTVIIKVALLPLTQKSYKSMKAMSTLQPLMTEIREKYKDDRDRMNQEMMALYKAHGVNPASGCLPMVAQLPIFLAFYRALYGTIELRHSPFALWIQDLSSPDPYYVTPIIMGITMFVSQKMTPSSADPMQQKIMMFMPVMFTFMFVNFPSGLVLYWLVNNILTIAQQLYLQKTMKPLVPPAAKTAKA